MGLKLSFTYKDIRKDEGGVKNIKPSEFCQGNYDQPDLIEVFRAELDECSSGEDIMIRLRAVCKHDKKLLLSPDIWTTLKAIKRLDSEYPDRSEDINV